MASNELELIVGYTLRRLEHDRRILWWHKFQPQILGQKYRTPAPLDFVFVTLRGISHYLECKEHGGRNIPGANFNEEQKRLLHLLPTAWIVARFHSPTARRGTSEYWEQVVILPGFCAPLPDKSSTVSIEKVNTGPTSARKIAIVEGTQVFGKDAHYGLNKAMKPADGYNSWPLSFMDRWEPLTWEESLANQKCPAALDTKSS